MKPTAEMKKVVHAAGRRTQLRGEIRELERTLRRTEERLLRKRELLRKVSEVSYAPDGIPLRVDGADVEEVTGTITRFTESYRNVRDGGTGIRFRRWGAGAVDVAIITSTTRAKAREYALAWVLRGELPKVPELLDHRPLSRR